MQKFEVLYIVWGLPNDLQAEPKLFGPAMEEDANEVFEEWCSDPELNNVTLYSLSEVGNNGNDMLNQHNQLNS